MYKEIKDLREARFHRESKVSALTIEMQDSAKDKGSVKNPNINFSDSQGINGSILSNQKPKQFQHQDFEESAEVHLASQIGKIEDNTRYRISSTKTIVPAARRSTAIEYSQASQNGTPDS